MNGRATGGTAGTTASLGGGDPSDTLTNAAVTWAIDGADSGTSGAVTYADFANLADTGGGTFNVTTASVSGTIKGGTGSTQSYASIAGPVSDDLTDSAASAINRGGA